MKKNKNKKMAKNSFSDCYIGFFRLCASVSARATSRGHAFCREKPRPAGAGVGQGSRAAESAYYFPYIFSINSYCSVDAV